MRVAQDCPQAVEEEDWKTLPLIYRADSKTGGGVGTYDTRCLLVGASPAASPTNSVHAGCISAMKADMQLQLLKLKFLHAAVELCVMSCVQLCLVQTLIQSRTLAAGVDAYGQTISRYRLFILLIGLTVVEYIGCRGGCHEYSTDHDTVEIVEIIVVCRGGCGCDGATGPGRHQQPLQPQRPILPWRAGQPPWLRNQLCRSSF